MDYQILAEPRPMHVIVPEGAKKFSFSNVLTWEDLLMVGPTYPFNANIEVVAIAHVPIGQETAMYYMDAHALGIDYASTGRPTYTIGFNHSHLADGYIEPTKKPIPPERQQRINTLIQSQNDQPSPELAALPTTEIDYRDVDNATDLYKWVSTYVPFEDGPKVFTFKNDEWVKDFTSRRSDKFIKAGNEYAFAGTFIYDDVEYVRPSAAAKNFLWYAARRDNLLSEDELYNTDIPLHERVALKHGRLSPSERYITVPLAKAISQTTRLKANLGKIKNKKRSEE